MSSFENPEDQKLATLALSTQKRTGAPQAAALRDSTGRTYVAISISAPELKLDAIQAVFTVAMASQISALKQLCSQESHQELQALSIHIHPLLQSFISMSQARSLR